MKTATKATRSAVLAGAAATLAIASMGFAGVAQARDNVYWSVGVGTPGAVVNVGNAGFYQPPVYVQPQPVYVEPAPVYYQRPPVYVRPAPVYYAPQPVYYQRPPVYVRPAPVYYAPQPVYYERPHHRHHREGFYQQAPRGYYGQSYGPVVFDRDGRGDNRHDGNQEGNEPLVIKRARGEIDAEHQATPRSPARVSVSSV